MGEIFRPSRAAFFRSLLFAGSPAGLATITVLLAGQQMNWFGWVASGSMGVLTLYLGVQTVFVFSTRIAVDAKGLAILPPFGAIGIPWTHVERAVLRERVNALTSTDRMLVLTGAGKQVICHPSVLSPDDQERLLTLVRSQVEVIVQRDKPSI